MTLHRKNVHTKTKDSRAFKEESTLIRHKKTIHEDKQMVNYDIIGKMFSKLGLPPLHMKKAHLGAKMPTCDICGQSYTN